VTDEQETGLVTAWARIMAQQNDQTTHICSPMSENANIDKITPEMPVECVIKEWEK